MPEATINNDYSANITISGKDSDRDEFVDKKRLFVTITPENSGISYEPTKTPYIWKDKKGVDINYNKLIIKGKPVVLGDIKINISGHTYGTLANSRGNEFNKTYILKVKPDDKKEKK
ncbi:MAG: hypothetical protein LBI71_02735 [Enterobacteriaceae bacterium]|nr:hypothetical protein [Enterobacteriaceae bacterium]